MDETIDYAEVSRIFQAENEKLRLYIFNMKNSEPSFLAVEKERVFDWIADHAMLIVAITSVAVILLSMVDIGLRMVRGRNDKNA